MGDIERVLSRGVTSDEMMNTFVHHWWLIMQERDLCRFTEPSTVSDLCGSEISGLFGAQERGVSAVRVSARFDGGECVASAELLRGYDALLVEWAGDFVADDGTRTDAQAMDSLVRLLQAGTDAAVWKVDDAGLTAAFLMSGIRRVAALAPGGRKTGAFMPTSSVAKLCRRVLGHAVAS